MEGGGGGERERERERGGAGREREREREREGERERRERETDRQTDRQTGLRGPGQRKCKRVQHHPLSATAAKQLQACGVRSDGSHRLMPCQDRQTNRQTERQTDRPTDRQTNRQDRVDTVSANAREFNTILCLLLLRNSFRLLEYGQTALTS